MPVFTAFREARTVALLAVLWAIWGLAMAMGEVIPVNDGLGWDGVRFSKMVEGGPALLVGREINSYYVQRVGPSFAVRLMLQVGGVPIEAHSIRLGFVVWNLTLLSLALVLIMDAARRVSLPAAARWLLFLGLFANPGNGRLPVYYATIGDSTAFFLGALILWAYIARQPLVTALAFLFAVVSWPAAFLLLPLLVWPRSSGEVPVAPPLPVWGVRLGALVAAPVGFGLLALITTTVEMPEVAAWSPATIASVSTNSLQLGVAAFLFVALAFVNRGSLRSWPSVFGVIAAVAVIAISVGYVRRFESGSLAFSGATFLREVLLFARSGPFAALVGHAAYYSSLAVAAVVVWPEVLRQALRFGPGAFITAGLCGLMALDAESRRLNAYWPVVGFLTILALERLWTVRAQAVTFGIAALAFSKLWWPLTGPPLFEPAHEPGNYFNTQGPSMSTEAMLVHALAAVAFGLWVWLKGAPRRSSASA